MIKKINQYRNSPKRTILTFKNRSSIYLLKRGEMLNSNCHRGGCYGGFAGGKDLNEGEIFAFKSHDNYCNEDYCEVESDTADEVSDEEMLCNVYNQSDDNNVAISCSDKLKIREKTTKGAFVCEKTLRIRLCDMMALICAGITACVVIKSAFKHK